MKKSRFSEDQIAFAPRLGESGTPVADVSRRTPAHRPSHYFGTSPGSDFFV
jgi:hypothetical protein